MRSIELRCLRPAVTIALLLSLVATSQGGERTPVISARTYVAGNAEVTVTGTFQMRATIPINVPASISDGEMTWLQYGVSGAEEPNALVTVSLDEIGINAARGKQTATVSAHECKGDLSVSGASVTGSYDCPDVTSYDPRSGKMGSVRIVIRFSATS